MKENHQKKYQIHAFEKIEILMNIVEFGCQCSQVLIVDDIDMNRYVIREILRSKFGILAEEATNGKECLKLIKDKSVNECCSYFKVVFMDYEMPVLNGLEAAKKIRQYFNEGRIVSNSQVVGYTAYTDEEQACKNAGMNYFLPKPASFNQIRQILIEIDEKLGRFDTS